MTKILLVEDETQVASFIRKGLTEEGFEISIAFDGITGLKMAQDDVFHLIILDIMLPQMNGLDVCREIRKTDLQTPILLLTALGTSENIVVGLESGADDYLVKPFRFNELVARIRALLRRTTVVSKQLNSDLAEEIPVLKFDDIELNDYTKTVTRNKQVITLTSTEYKLLHFFMRNPQKVLSRMDILDEVWGVNYDLGTNIVDVYVNYLRKKLDVESENKCIHTVIGMGYVMK